MSSRLKWYVGTLVILALVGCGYSRVVGPERVRIGGLYTVDPQIRWSRFYQKGIETWTVDGPALEALHFINVKKDRPLVATKDPKKWPRFSPSMSESEIMEFVVDSLARLGYAQLQAHDLRPTSFGRLQGFCFDLMFLFPDGLEGQGLAVGAVIEESLQLILYIGTREHYYPKHLEEVEGIARSIELRY